MIKRSPLIGVFDSGVGGLTVVKELLLALPHSNICYLGDTARVPYGSKSPETVERYALSCLKFLRAKGAEMVLVACNTASANALDSLQKHGDHPVIGAVKPGSMAAAALTRSNKVAVIGTLATIESDAYTKAIQAINPLVQVFGKACPLLVPLVEEGWLAHPVTCEVIKTYLSPMFEDQPEIDCLVLGCTHYPLLRDTIKSTLKSMGMGHVSIVDSAQTMAKLTKEKTPPNTSQKQGRLNVYVTDATRIQTIGAQFLGHELEHFELVDLQT